MADDVLAQHFTPFLPEDVSVSRLPEPEPLFRPVTEGEPFPTEALPEGIRAGARGAHGRTQAPLALCAQSAMATASLGAARLANVRLQTGQVVPTTLFLVTVAASGERKTSTDRELSVAIREFESELTRQYVIDAEQHRIRSSAWETMNKEAHRRHRRDRAALEEALHALGPPPTPPFSPLITPGGDPTVEGLWLLLRDGPGYAGIFTAEGGTFVGSHAMNAENKIRSAGMLSDAWDGSPWKRSRRGDGNSVLNNRRVALHLMVQPDVAGAFLSDRTLLDQGLLSRTLVAAPPSAMGNRFGERSQESERELARYTADARALWQEPARYLEHERGALDLRTVVATPAAAEVVEAFAYWVEKQQGESGAFRPISGFAAKMAEQAMRIAATFALFRDPLAVTIDFDDMDRAVALTRWYGTEALRLFDQGRIPSHLQTAERVRQWLVRDWPEDLISLPDLYQRGPRDIRTAEKARAVVGTLEERRWLIRLGGGGKVSGTFRREVWRINRGVAT